MISKSINLKKRLLPVLLVAVLLLGLIAPFVIDTASAAPLPDLPEEVIENHPSRFDGYTPGNITTNNLTFDEVAFSETKNHAGTKEHYISKGMYIANPRLLIFEGYGQSAYMDDYFLDDGGLFNINFTLTPMTMNFHTFSETGFLFNGSFDSNHRYTGYAIVLSQNAVEEGVASNGTAAMHLVYIANELFDNNSFRPGSTATTRQILATIKTGIENLSTASFTINLDRELNGSFKLSLDGKEVFRTNTPKTSESSFGFYTGYYRHSCAIKTIMQYELNNLTTKRVYPTIQDVPEAYATVKFVDAKTDDEIANPQTVPSNAANYMTTPPAGLYTASPDHKGFVETDSRLHHHKR
jgi:hypothetical protein